MKPVQETDKSLDPSIFCEGVGGAQGALSLFCGGVAQTCHDDRVVELKEQLVVEEVDGERQEGKVKEEGRDRVKERAPCPITVHQVSPINQCWVHRRGDAQMKNTTRILASSTRMRKSFATFGNKLYPPDS